jgi:hypothetical protein
MDNIGIFVFGLVVFGMAIGATFCALIATDHPEEEHSAEDDSQFSSHKEAQ